MAASWWFLIVSLSLIVLDLAGASSTVTTTGVLHNNSHRTPLLDSPMLPSSSVVVGLWADRDHDHPPQPLGYAHRRSLLPPSSTASPWVTSREVEDTVRSLLFSSPPSLSIYDSELVGGTFGVAPVNWQKREEGGNASRRPPLPPPELHWIYLSLYNTTEDENAVPPTTVEAVGAAVRKQHSVLQHYFQLETVPLEEEEEGKEAPPPPPPPTGRNQVRETVILYSSTGTYNSEVVEQARLNVGLKGEAYKVIHFKVKPGNVVEVVSQLRNPFAQQNQCDGLFLSVKMGYSDVEHFSSHVPKYTTTTTTTSPPPVNVSAKPKFQNVGLPHRDPEYETIQKMTKGALAAFWDSFVLLFDTSSFCEVYPTVSMRSYKKNTTHLDAKDTPSEDENADFYILVQSTVSNAYTWSQRLENRSLDPPCRLDLYIQQTPQKQLYRSIFLYAFVIPLLIVVLPLPLLLWRADIIQNYFMQEDLGETVWVLPYAIVEWIENLEENPLWRNSGWYRYYRYTFRAKLQAFRSKVSGWLLCSRKSIKPATGEEMHPVGSSGWAGPSAASGPTPHTHSNKEEDRNPTTGGAGPSGNNNNNNNNKWTEEKEEPICRICRDGDEFEKLVTPCACTGSVRYVHHTCLDHWRIIHLQHLKQYHLNNNGLAQNKRYYYNLYTTCEICHQRFQLSVLWSSLFRQTIHLCRRAILLLAGVGLILYLLSVALFAVLGPLSCSAVYHTVHYSGQHQLEGFALSLFAYFFLVLLFRFSGLVAHGCLFRDREDAMAFARREYNMLNNNHQRRPEELLHLPVPLLPPRSHTLLFLLKAFISLILTSQAFAMGYLFKCFLYTTSRVAWSWETAPLMGSILLVIALTCGAALASCCRYAWTEWRLSREEGLPPPPNAVGRVI